MAGKQVGTDFDAARVKLVMLQVIRQYEARGPEDFQAAPLLTEVVRRLGVPQLRATEQALLTVWHDLFRSGVLSYGFDLANPSPPFCHLTDRGRETLKQAGRDPSNPDGFLEHLKQLGFSDSVAESYVGEALNTYNANCFKASAVMIGAATERMVLWLRDNVVLAMQAAAKTIPTKLEDWRYKTVRDALTVEFDARKATMVRHLVEAYSAFWTPLTEQPRIARNDSGHPVSIDPVTPETVHASLLIFPELVRLILQLDSWIKPNV